MTENNVRIKTFILQQFFAIYIEYGAVNYLNVIQV